MEEGGGGSIHAMRCAAGEGVKSAATDGAGGVQNSEKCEQFIRKDMEGKQQQRRRQQQQQQQQQQVH